MRTLGKSIVIVIVLSTLIYACGSQPERRATESEEPATSQTFNNKDTDAFYRNLSSLCGKKFAGQQVYIQEGRESWAHLPMIMHLSHCSPTELHIPFQVGENRSRTWMFINEDGRLRFRHDHRHEDGTPEEMTLYGGYANENGTPFRQEFPADDYTIGIHPRSNGSYWVVELAKDMSSFSYQLHHNGELIFQADFDLTQELED